MIWFAIPIGVIVLSAVGTAVKFAWDYFSGKEVVFLLHGGIQAGKSTIVTALSGKEYKEYTNQHEEIDISGSIKNDFKALAMIDVGGDKKAENEDVREEFFKKDALKSFLYVFDARDLKDGDFSKRERIKNEIGTYRDICKKKDVLFLAIGTRADKLGKERSKEVMEEIRKELGVKTFVINAEDKDEVLAIFGDILKLIQEKYQ